MFRVKGSGFQQIFRVEGLEFSVYGLGSRG
jgi:hypothetical protein